MISYEGRNARTVNQLKVIQFDHPDWTPCGVGLMPATWMRHREALEEIVFAHPRIFPGYKKGSKEFDRVGGGLYEIGERTDSWGVTWKNVERGLSSLVVGHPLEDWAAFETWRPPEPLRDAAFGPQPSWEEVAERFERAKERGEVASAGPFQHGFFYMRLYYLRGFENFMMDLAADDARIRELITIVERYNVTLIDKHLDLGAEYMSFGDDLGMQESLPMSPATWRRFIKPSYEAMLGRCRDRGVPVYLHTDGHVLEIIPDLIETGVRVLNPQIGANGIEGLKDAARGKVAMNVDLDRQLFPFATPSEIEDHIGAVYEGLYFEEGGLMLFAEIEPDVPLENVEAVCSTLERLCNPPEP
ncbi:MAG: uroporphyrinogen decarboxylase family protein [Planctomycetota bacterium]